MRIIEIADISDPAIEAYTRVRERQLVMPGPSDPSRFMAEGELVVRRLIASAHATESLLITSLRLQAMSDVLHALPDPTPVYVLSQALMNEVIGFPLHRGVMAIGRRAPGPDADTIAASGRLIVVMENLVNHDNIGGIFRNAAAFGASGVLLTPGCADPFYRKSIRVSVGHVLTVPSARLTEGPSTLTRLKAAGLRLLALTPAPGSIPLDALGVGPADRIALLVGAEGPGLTPDALAAADARIRIPIAPCVDSLNANVAAAIALYGCSQRLFPEAWQGHA